MMEDEAAVGAGPPDGYRSNSRRRGVRGKQNPGLQGQASWVSCVINLVNTIVSAGVLAMPLAISHMGIVLGIFVILWSGVMAGFGLYLQSLCAQYLDRGNTSFFALSQITYPNAAVVFDGAIAIKLIIIPLSYLHRLDSLKYTSIAALVSMGYLVVLVVYHFIIGDTKTDRGLICVIHWAGAVPTLSSFPVIVFAFTCHQNMFSILNEIQNNSHFRTTAVMLASIRSSATTYILVAITGYLSFGNSVGGNIIGMYPPGVWAMIGRAAIVILVMFSYPLQCHPCRASIDASYIVAMTVSSLEAVLAYVGSTGSTSISFILPGIFYYKISAPDSPTHQRLMKEDDEAEDAYISGASDVEDGGGQARPLSENLLRKLSLALAVYGVIVMITCLVMNSVFLASS
ncbi:transmembrane amino acid transporter protein-domain-containing protein [Aspergillus spectabilis]